MDPISLDDWELLLPDHKSSFCMDAEFSNGIHGVVGGKDQFLLGAELVVIDMDHFGPTSSHPPRPNDYCILDEAKKPLLLLPSKEDVDGSDPMIADCKDIDVMAAEPEREDLMGEVTEILLYEAEEQEEEMNKPVKAADQDDDGVLVEAAAPDGVSQCAREEEEEEEEGVCKTGFSVGSMRVHGVGALCSFGVAAATFCILLLGGGGKQQQLHKRQGHKIQLQMYADDERIQQVVQQASRLNQTMSSVMGGASSARASISFGGHYQGF